MFYLLERDEEMFSILVIGLKQTIKLRRLLLTEIKGLAIDKINIEINTSSFAHELVLNRLEFIGIKPLVDDITLLENIDAKVNFSYTNNTDKIIKVYSHHLHCDSDIVKITPNILITVLMPKACLSFEASIVFNKAIQDRKST